MRTIRTTLAILFASALLASGAAAQSMKAPEGGQSSIAKQSSAKPSNEKPTGVVTWDKIAGNWKSFRGRVRQQWGKLTHNDLQVAQGKRDVLVGKIQSRYGIDKDKADQQVDAWLKQQQ